MNIKTLAVAATLALGASAGFAQEAAPIALTLTASGSTLQTTFQRSVSGLFVDTFSFTPQNVTGPVSVTLTPLGGPVSFFAALLNDEGFSYLPESGQPTFSFQSVATAANPLSLTVFGYAGDADTLADASGSYSGIIRIATTAPIPEPETYALMLAGLAAIGAARRQQAREATPRR